MSVRETYGARSTGLLSQMSPKVGREDTGLGGRASCILQAWVVLVLRPQESATFLLLSETWVPRVLSHFMTVLTTVIK